MDAKVIETDVLVVGGGLAGCWAALRARDFVDDVTLVDKGVVARAGTTVFRHTLMAGAPEDELDRWVQDGAEHSEFMCEQPFARVLLNEEGDRIRDLAGWGVPFERDEKGDLSLSVGRGHKNSRVLLVDCRMLMEIMRAQVQAKGVRLVERVMITDLLTSDGQCPTSGRVNGAVGINTRDGQLIVFKARAVFLSTGRIGAKTHIAYCDNVTGDGQAMAFRVGAEAAGLEFNFGPHWFCSYQGRFHLLSVLWPLQTEGAYIVNGRGERFLERYAPVGIRIATSALLHLLYEEPGRAGADPAFGQINYFLPYPQPSLLLPH